MVVTFLPARLETGVTQERTACPLTWTVHAPHSAMPQPNFVPVMPSVSRRYHSKGISGSVVRRLRLAVQIEPDGCHEKLLRSSFRQVGGGKQAGKGIWQIADTRSYARSPIDRVYMGYQRPLR